MARNLDTISPKKSALPKEAAFLQEKTAPAEPTVAAEDSYAALFPEPTVSIKKPSWIVGVFIALLLIGGGGTLAYTQLNSQINHWLSVPAVPVKQSTNIATQPAPTPKNSTPTPPATTAPVAPPAATAAPAVTDKKSITIRVLNGTNTAGAAAGARTALENAGFSVQSIGNAQSRSYQTTVIYYQTGKEAEAKLVQSGLNNYSTTLQESDLAAPSMILVVVGVN